MIPEDQTQGGIAMCKHNVQVKQVQMKNDYMKSS